MNSNLTAPDSPCQIREWPIKVDSHDPIWQNLQMMGFEPILACTLYRKEHYD